MSKEAAGVPDPLLLLPTDTEPLYRPLLSGELLPDHICGWWALDEPDLPDDLRLIHWCNAVCLAGLAWLVDSSSAVDCDHLSQVLEDIWRSLQDVHPAIRVAGPEIQLKGRSEGVRAMGCWYPSLTHATNRIAYRQVHLARKQAGTRAISALVECWPAIHATLAPAFAADPEVLSMLAEGQLRELRRVAEHRKGREQRARQAKNKAPIQADDVDILRALDDAGSALQWKALVTAAGLKRNSAARGTFSRLCKDGFMESTPEGYRLTAKGRVVLG